MAPLKGHLDQAGHHRTHPQPRLQHQPHHQRPHQELAEGQDQGQQDLGPQRPPEGTWLGQGFGHQQGAENQG